MALSRLSSKVFRRILRSPEGQEFLKTKGQRRSFGILQIESQTRFPGRCQARSFCSLQNSKLAVTEERKANVDPLEYFQRINWHKIINPAWRLAIEENLKRRDVKVDLDKIVDLYTKVVISRGKMSMDDLKELINEALKLPNDTHLKAMECSDTDSNIIHLEGVQPSENYLEFHAFCKNKNLLRSDNLGNIAGHKAYFLKGPLAELEQALIKFTVNKLQKHGFSMLSVPDILYPNIIESCGMIIQGERSQVYFLEDPSSSQDVSLSGTAEMAIGGFLQDKLLNLDELPLKLAAVSRCYRAETSSLEEESGLYRVHYFTKVEMFGVTANETGNESNDLQEEFLRIQQELFKELKLNYRVLEMPPFELGLSAHRKFDIEAWMPGKKDFGEISSCSNCTDFQSRRLNIRYRSRNAINYAHTVNGTACAVPRMIISLVETFQTPSGSVELPAAIEDCMARPWSESVASNPNVEFNFLRTKTQMDRVTSDYL